MVLSMYFADNPNGADALRGAPVVTVFNQESSNLRKSAEARSKPMSYEQITVFDPCGTNQAGKAKPDYLGCFQSTGEFGIIPVLHDTDNKDKP